MARWWPRGAPSTNRRAYANQTRRNAPTVAQVPWARHGAGHTRDFDDQVAWLAAACSKTTITQLMRVSWRTVGHIIERVSAEHLAAADPLAGLARIGIDEISYYRKGRRHPTIGVDHDTGRLVWAHPGRREGGSV